MELLIINKENTTFYHEDELEMLKIGIVFSDKVTIVSPNYYDFLKYCKIDASSDKKALAYYLEKLKESEREDIEKLTLEGQTLYDEMVELQHFKYKDQEMIIHMERLIRSFKAMKEGNSGLEQEHLETEHTWPLMNFYRDKIVAVIPLDFEENYKSESVPDRLIKSFLSKDALHFFDDCGYTELEYESDPLDGFLTVELFKIPDLNNLEYAQLKLMRNEFRDQFKPFYRAVSAMQKEFSTVLYNKKSQDAVSARTETILQPFIKFIGEAVKENIYVHQIRNQTDNTLTYSMNFCVARIEKVVRLYEERGIINNDEARYVLESIESKKDIESSCFFFFLSCQDLEENSLES